MVGSPSPSLLPTARVACPGNPHRRGPGSRPPAGSLAADLVHPRDGRVLARVERMAHRLVAHGGHDDRLDLALARAGAQRGADVEARILEEAEVELTGGGKAHAIAVAAERLAHRADEADDAGRARQA